MPDTFDLVVIGGGPGGYNCAIRAAQLGMNVACVETRATLGGTCLNVGCIPSKALLHATEIYQSANTIFPKLGVMAEDVKVDLAAMMKHKDASVEGLTKGIEFLFKKNGVTHISGHGKLLAPGRVEVTATDGLSRVLEADHVVIASGSEVMGLAGIEIDEERIVSSTGALALKKVPDHMVVVGGGVIGLELGSVWRRLGSKVTVVEFLDAITPGLDAEISKQFQRTLKKQGFVFKLGSKVTAVEKKKNALSVSVEPAKGGAGQEIACDVVMVAIGRKPFTQGLGLEDVGVVVTPRGFIPTEEFQTNIEGIYAIGDVTHGPMLAHKAEDEGMAAAEMIAGTAGHVNYDVIPSVIYTHPEVATVGKTEEELKEAGIAYKVGKFPFTANARARVNLDTEGFVKILADAETDRVLGVHMIGPEVGNMIGEAAIAMEFGASAEDIARTCHAHPTLTETIRQAALGVDDRIMQM